MKKQDLNTPKLAYTSKSYITVYIDVDSRKIVV